MTAWKASVFGVFLVRIFPHSDWIRTLLTQWIANCWILFFNKDLGQNFFPEHLRATTFEVLTHFMPTENVSHCRGYKNGTLNQYELNKLNDSAQIVIVRNVLDLFNFHGITFNCNVRLILFFSKKYLDFFSNQIWIC